MDVMGGKSGVVALHCLGYVVVCLHAVVATPRCAGVSMCPACY